MDKNTKDLLETVIFIKDHMIANMATKDDVHEIVNEAVGVLRKEMQAGFAGGISRMGAIDNRIDNEMFARKDLETRVRVVLPSLPLSPERV